MKKRILIVDDSDIIRQQLRLCLEPAGYEVIERNSGEAGLDKARQGAFDLVLSDVNMPGIGGLEMVTRLRQLPGHQKTPVFMLTTESSREMAQKGKEVGATVWIVKPFKPDVLLKGVAKVTGSL